MKSGIINAGFIGAGGIARSHAYSLAALKYYYDDAPLVNLSAVCSANKNSRDSFAQRYGFASSCTPAEFFANDSVDTVFILGPNSIHYENLRDALAMKSARRIYLEKPVCSSLEQEKEILQLSKNYPGVKIQVGFQYLFSPAVREALRTWHSGALGEPVHFDIRYYHSDYLRQEYRLKRRNRLTPAPDGGAMADLGSHAISLLIAFLGSDLKIVSAIQAGSFDDVPAGSDLFSLISISDSKSGAAGTIGASRISSGTGDELSIELYATEGAIRYSSVRPEYFEQYSEKTGSWSRTATGSNYRPVTSFPSGHVPPGWLRAMVHAHYLFLGGTSDEVIIPGINHGLEVQRLVRETAEHLEIFRKKISS